jgi:hypothetical protein
MGYLGTKPANAVLTSEQIGNGVITSADIASGVTINFADGSASTPSITNDGDSNTGIFFPAADTIAFSEGGAEVARFDSSGNLGIGTSSPTAKLHVAGNMRITGVSAGIAAITIPSGDIIGDVSSGAMAIGNVGDTSSETRIITRGFTAFRTGATDGVTGTERMRITSSGNLLVGTTNNSENSRFVFYNPSGRAGYFQQADTGNWGLCVDTPNNYTDTNFLARNYRTSGFTDFNFFVGQANGVNRIQIRGDGNLLNLNNSYGGISDIKLKENIVDATPKLERLNQVRVVNYNLIGEEQKQIGVIAQELEQIFPSMIEETKDKDEQGNDLGTTTKAVKYSVFVPMLIKAIQEQQALINDLTTRLTALENK